MTSIIVNSIKSTLLLCLMIPISGLTQPSEDTQFKKSTVQSIVRFDVNNIRAYVTNYGSLFRNDSTGNAGFEWPKGSGRTAIYASGLWISAKVDNEVRVVASAYGYDYKPGSIDSKTYLPNDPEDPDFKVYKIEKGNYASRDYKNWPYFDGAPVNDDGNPLFLGDQTLWCVYNDADSTGRMRFLSKPLGCEIQQTVFGWDAYYLNLDDLVFLRFLIINKSINNWDSCYAALWTSVDLGDAQDDKRGCDSTLSLSFTYNESDHDDEYGAQPPAVGFQILQGPLVPSPGDTGIFIGERRFGYKNLPMTSFIEEGGGTHYSGDSQTPRDAYFRMQARWRNGQHLTYGDDGTNPNNPVTNYMYSGDPETGTGWISSFATGGIESLTSCGPFNLASGDSQEVVIAVRVARGMSNLNSVTLLKQQGSLLQTAYEDSLYSLLEYSYPVELSIEDYRLFQNYPNPFNETTIIEYQIPRANDVKLEIHNVLGQKVATLVNRFQQKDQYQVEWDAREYASGIYFYRLTAGEFQQTKKLLLIK